MEVLSPSTRDFDTFKKLDEYKETCSLEYIVLVEPNEPVAFVWRRDGARGWVEARIPAWTRGSTCQRSASRCRWPSSERALSSLSGPGSSRRRNERGRLRHCERSEAIHPYTRQCVEAFATTAV